MTESWPFECHGCMDTRGLRVLALLNITNYSTVVDQSDYSISTILYNIRS